MLQKIYDRVRQAALLSSIADTLEWDERTGAPAAAGDYRAAQVAEIRLRAHEASVCDELGRWLENDDDKLGVAPESVDAGNLRRIRRDFDKQRRLPAELVHEEARLTSVGQNRWQKARQDNDFASLAPTLREIVAIKQQIGELLSRDGDATAYDGLLDQYEPDVSSATVADVFDHLREPLVQLIRQASVDADHPDAVAMRRPMPIEGQRQLSRWAAETIGFDFSRGRLDETTHPFCTTLGPHDIRILSRYEERWLPGGLYGTLHEAGHGMYEQGLNPESFGLPAGRYASLGIHESQSRLWENQVGRSHGFVQRLLPKMQQIFGDAADWSADSLYRGVNLITPSLIRVEADEATYNLHIMIRFDLERSLIDGSLSVDDLPAAWNERYRRDLGIEVPSDTLGVLQDVHWSAGLFGYFPTYTIGNLAAAQMFDAAAQSIGFLPDAMSIDDMRGLHQWLADHVYRHGQLMNTDQIVRSATGNPLGDSSLINYLRAKHSRK